MKRARTAKLGLTLLVLASAAGLLSACTGVGTPSAGASLACSSSYGGRREGGGSEYLWCLRVHGPDAAAYRSVS